MDMLGLDALGLDALGVDPETLMTLIGTLLIVGCVAGLLAGLLGVGGGIVVVPGMFYALGAIGVDADIRMHLAVGTSLATIIPTAMSSIRAHHKRGSVDVELLKSWIPAVVAGVALGTWAASLLEGEALTFVFAAFAVCVAVYMGLAPETKAIAKEMPANPVRGLYGLLIGSVSAMMGIGGATLSVPIMSLYSIPIHRAVGTASAIGLVIALPGAVGFILTGWGAAGLPPFSLGYVSLAGFLVIIPATVLVAPLGAKLAHALPRQLLRRVFAGFLAIAVSRMVYEML